MYIIIIYFMLFNIFIYKPKIKFKTKIKWKRNVHVDVYSGINI